jgi:hypothetical protein
METEKNPDREGYLDFKRRVEDGDIMLDRRAGYEWEKDPFDFQEPSAWYYVLRLTEQFQTRHRIADDKREDSIRDAERRMALVSDATVRKQGYARIRERVDAWAEEREQLRRDHLETRERSIGERIATRQAAHPGERESESWFWAKYDTEQEHLGHLLEIGNKLRREMEGIAEVAREQESLAAPGEAESPGISRASASRRDRDDGRER